MGFKNFRVNVVGRVLAIMFSVVLLLFVIRHQSFFMTSAILALLIIVQIASLVKYVERTNRKLSLFFDTIRHSDFSSSFSDHGLGSSFDDLNQAFNEVISAFQKTRAAKEEHFNYMQTVVQHVSIAIIVFKKDGNVHLVNNAFKRLFRASNLRYINELAAIDENLSELLLNIKAGESELLKVFNGVELLQLSVKATEFRMQTDDFVLVSLQNIHSELEAKEMDSWQKLIRVLTHEIMNSITPIVSLSSTVKELLTGEEEEEEKVNTDISPEDAESIQSALTTIERRSRGLLNFVEVYRNLTRIPKPSFRHFEVLTLLQNIEDLLQPKIKEVNIQYTSKALPANLKLTADPDLIEQVLINLVINAIHAVKDVENPRIQIMASATSQHHVSISVSDNGYGIKPDNLEQIFVPFFTSKKEGSGIGLSLAREIMRLHKGSIDVQSKPMEETRFTLRF